jgi:hypothetical protein
MTHSDHSSGLRLMTDIIALPPRKQFDLLMTSARYPFIMTCQLAHRKN